VLPLDFGKFCNCQYSLCEWLVVYSHVNLVH
jgi:hypothetical protein